MPRLVAVHAVNNFDRIHLSLRFTPRIAAGLSSMILGLEKIGTGLLAPAKRGPSRIAGIVALIKWAAVYRAQPSASEIEAIKEKIQSEALKKYLEVSPD